jgi:hypothetical protein
MLVGLVLSEGSRKEFDPYFDLSSFELQSVFFA